MFASQGITHPQSSHFVHRPLKILFWLLVTCDTLVLLLFFVLGLAAAPSSKTSPFAVAAFVLIVPGLILATAVLLFTRSNSPLGRSAALLLAAAPVLVLVLMRTVSTVQLKQSQNAQGELVYFRSGPLREISEAIERNDTATVARLAPAADLNNRGYSNTTLLALALRKLKDTPTETGNLQILLNAGADANLQADDLPLEIALQQARFTGATPAIMLLKAGANPNTRNQFGTPVFFTATGKTIPPEVLSAVLDHGVDLTTTDKDGRPVVFYAANSANWPAVLLLLERGVDYRNGRTVNGESFNAMVESYARTFGDTAGVAAVVEFLKRH